MIEYLKKIEPILFEKAREMKVPVIEEDLGILLFEATYYRYSKDSIYKEKALTLLNTLINVLPTRELFFGGFLESLESIFYVIQYLKKCNIIDDETLLDDLNPYLLQTLKRDIKMNYFDVLHGSINKLQYIISSKNWNEEETNELINDFIDSLYNNRQENNQGIYWFEDVYEDEKLVNLGIPHGIPGVLLFLTKLKKLGYSHPKMNIIIDGIIQSLINFKNKTISASQYADYYSDNTKIDASSRLAYCYGDLGVAYTFLYANTILKREDLKTEGTKIVDSIVKRWMSNSQINHYEEYFFFETAFCHGLSGIIYMLKKISFLIDSPALEKRILFWIDQLKYNLEIQLKIKGDIYYPQSRQLNDGTDPFIIDEQSMLSGYTGTGLVLLSLYYNKYDWSDFFVLY